MRGGANEPARDTWRSSAAPPFAPVSNTSLASVDGVVYALVPANRVGSDGKAVRPRFFSYDAAADAWRRLAGPPSLETRIVAAGDRLFSAAEDQHRRTGMFYDPGTGRWTPAPRRNPAQSYGGTVVGLAGGQVVWLGATVRPDTVGPTFYEAAVLDAGGRAWRRLPRAPFAVSDHYIPEWGAVGSRVVNLDPTRTDGYPRAERRTYPGGGQLDVASGTWVPLPPGPDADRTTGSEWGLAAGDESASWRGWVLDVRRQAWTTLPPVPGYPELRSPARVWVGDRLFIWGGAYPVDAPAGSRESDRAWMWAPDAGVAGAAPPAGAG